MEGPAAVPSASAGSVAQPEVVMTPSGASTQQAQTGPAKIEVAAPNVSAQGTGPAQVVIPEQNATPAQPEVVVQGSQPSDTQQKTVVSSSGTSSTTTTTRTVVDSSSSSDETDSARTAAIDKADEEQKEFGKPVKPVKRNGGTFKAGGGTTRGGGAGRRKTD